MRKLIPVLGLFLTFGSCKDSEIEKPVASHFDIQPGKQSIFAFPVANQPLTLTNTSANAVTYSWDFGNGLTSIEKEPTIIYSQRGDYTISLTATGKDGLKSTSSKFVHVFAPYILFVTLISLNWNSFGELPSWDSSKQADVFFEIRQLGEGDSLQYSNGDYNGTTVFSTIPLKDLQMNQAPRDMELPINNYFFDFSYLLSKRLALNVYAQDTNGKHVLSSTWAAAGYNYWYVYQDFQYYYYLSSGQQGTSIEIEFLFK